MEKALRQLIFLAALWPCLAAAAAPTPADTVLACMKANLPESIRVEELSIVSADRAGGTRALRGILYARRVDGLVQAMLGIHEPADLAGSDYLARETAEGGQEIYMFLPALGKVRRVRAENMDTSMLGTDLKYGDLRSLASAFAGSHPVLEGTQRQDGRSETVLSAEGGEGSNARYDRVRAWVDEESCVALRVVFYKGAVPEREFRVAPQSLVHAGRYWYTREATMLDLLMSTRTTVTVLGVHDGESVADRVFDPHLFYVGNN